ncbi:MAG: DUF2782 domain-containing protein [Gammaproteobacteria bacterium]
MLGEPINPDGLEVVPEPPPLPEPVQSGEVLEPEITIIQKEEVTVEEYRINGILYMVKVTPSVGLPYYLIDQDGDGVMETQMDGIYADPVVPQWVLFSW